MLKTSIRQADFRSDADPNPHDQPPSAGVEGAAEPRLNSAEPMMSGPQSLTIDSTWLHAADGSLSQPDSALVYTIKALPHNGTLTVNGTTLALNGQFTQQQIDDGLVVYTDSAIDDSFGFSISDASSNDLAAGTLELDSFGSTPWTTFSKLTMTGGTGAVVFYAGLGSFNTFTGGTDTTVSYALAPAATTIALNGGLTENGFGSADKLVNIHNVIGSSHDDVILSGPGTNVIYGGGGNDQIIGDPTVADASTTTAGYSGARSDYLIVGETSVSVKIIDLRPGSPDGVDEVVWANSFKFSDGTYTFSQLNPINEADQTGATDVAMIGNNYFLYAHNTETGPELTFVGTPVTQAFGSVVGAEATANGYYVVLYLGSNSDLYQVWNVDSSGKWVSTPLGNINELNAAFASVETTLQQDINHDGVIGAPPVSVVESFGSTTPTEVGDHYYLLANGTSSGPELMYLNSPAPIGFFGTMIGAEQTANGYDVVWHNSNGTYSAWSVDRGGNYVSNLLSNVSASDTRLQGLETIFHQDLNGDGTITSVQSLTIKMAVADPALTGVADPGSHIVYTIQVLPSLGKLTVNGVAATDGGQFTQDQLDQGLVVYTDDGSGTGSDLFSYSISDTLLNHNLGSGSLDTNHVSGTLGVQANIFSGGSDPVTFFSEAGNNSVGGTNVTVSYALAPASVFITLPTGASNGFGGNDSLSNISKVIGSSHNDTIFSGTGNSLIFGGGGNDTIWNTGGTPTAGFSGARSDYLVHVLNSEEVKITDLRPNSPDGTDDILSVHSFQFSDGTYSLDQLAPIESFGSTDLTKIGNNFFLYADGTANGPELKYLSAPWTAGEWGQWTPIGTEATATGYEVAFNLAGTNEYTVWNTDANGNLTSNPIGTVTGSSLTLQALETSFQQDLNHNGTVGLLAGETLIEAIGSTSLIEIGGNFLLDKAGGGATLQYDGAVFIAGQFGGWTPIGVEATATGYEVAFKVAGADLYTVWDTDANGNIIIDPIGTVSGESPTLIAMEKSFQQDLNGDGMIGNPALPITVEAFGSTSLVLSGNDYFLDPKGTSNGPMLKYGGAAWTDGEWGGWTPIGAEVTANGHEVAFNLAGTNQYTVWNTDANGNITTDTIGTVTGNSAALEGLETSFHQDLNGDGIIGDPSIPFAIETSGSTSLTQLGHDFFLYAHGPMLKYGGAAWTDGEWGGWTPIGADATAGGYEVAFKLTGADLYTVWNTDANGNITTNPIASASGNDASLQSIETNFHQDLNGDGVIGPPSHTSPAAAVAPITAPASGNAILSGTAASDSFVFNANFGNDTVGGFRPGADHVDIDHSLFASVADIVAHTADNAGSGAASTIGGDHPVIFDSVAKLLLQHASDFHLV
jgi:serralysin